MEPANPNTDQDKKKFPFIPIFKQAWEITWRNRFLWWFGFLIALGSPSGGFNFPGGGNPEDINKVSDFAQSHFKFLLGLGLTALLVGILLFFISIIAKAGLIKSVSLIALGHQEVNFKVGWRKGKKYLWKLFWLAFIFSLAVAVILLVLAVPVIYLFIMKSWVSAVIIALLAIAIFIPLMFIIAITKVFAEFYIILSDLKISDSIEAAYNLFLKNLFNTIIFKLLMFAVGIVAGIILLPAAIISFAIFIPLGVLLYSLNKIVFFVFISIVVLAFLTIVFLISAVLTTFTTTAWTLFFQEIAKIKINDEMLVKKADEEKVLPLAEKA